MGGLKEWERREKGESEREERECKGQVEWRDGRRLKGGKVRRRDRRGGRNIIRSVDLAHCQTYFVLKKK